jgi:hypothetical protein
MELERIEKILLKNLHKPVKIYWVNPEYDWHNWIVQDIDLIAKKVILIGRPQDSAEYDDTPETACFEEIKTVMAFKGPIQKQEQKQDQEVLLLMRKIGYESSTR